MSDFKLTPVTDEIIATFKIKRQSGYCAHKCVEVDAQQRTLNCERCGAIIEPFDFVLNLATKEMIQIGNIKMLESKIEELRTEWEKLDKDVRNLKAAKRRIS